MSSTLAGEASRRTCPDTAVGTGVANLRRRRRRRPPGRALQLWHSAQLTATQRLRQSSRNSPWRRISCASRITQGDRWPRPSWRWRSPPAARTTAPSEFDPQGTAADMAAAQDAFASGPTASFAAVGRDISAGAERLARSWPSSAALALPRPSARRARATPASSPPGARAPAPASRPASSAIPADVARRRPSSGTRAPTPTSSRT